MKEYFTEPHGAQSMTMIDQADTFGNSIFAVSDKYAHMVIHFTGEELLSLGAIIRMAAREQAVRP